MEVNLEQRGREAKKAHREPLALRVRGALQDHKEILVPSGLKVLPELWGLLETLVHKGPGERSVRWVPKAPWVCRDHRVFPVQ